MKYLNNIKPRYGQASKEGKTAILDEFCRPLANHKPKIKIVIKKADELV